MQYRLNTSNRGKLEEFQCLFAAHGHQLTATAIDIKEINADPITVVTHKASQLPEGVLVEDTSLEIEGASVGIHVKWLLDHLQECVGRKAHWIVLLAYHDKDKVHIYKGEVIGTIVEPRGKGGFGFDPVFLPDGAKHTLAEAKPDAVNARALAVKALLTQAKPHHTCSVLKDWQGEWQQ